jgi:predicted nucleotidyltransferase
MASKSALSLLPIFYSDTFNFPLTYEELWNFLPPSDIKKTELQSLILTNKKLFTKHGYICLKGKEKSIEVREKQEHIVNREKIRARRFAELLGIVPWVVCICLSGSLAAGHYKEEDDIDLFVVTKPNTVWLTRICLLGMLALLGKRRKKGQIHAPGSICLNMFVDTQGLRLEHLGKDIYIAREIAQLKPLVNKYNTFEQLLSQNQWIREFFPHAIPVLDVSIMAPLVSPYSRFFNGLAKIVQLPRIQKTRTTELIEEHLLAFHPGTYHEEILAQFEAKSRTIPH